MKPRVFPLVSNSSCQQGTPESSQRFSSKSSPNVRRVPTATVTNHQQSYCCCWRYDCAGLGSRRQYRMYEYVTRELPDIISTFPVDTSRSSLCGHSMGGHGALVVAFRRAMAIQKDHEGYPLFTLDGPTVSSNLTSIMYARLEVYGEILVSLVTNSPR